MTSTVPVSVIIPTYSRGIRVLDVLERIFQCDPLPEDIWIHIDASDGKLEHLLNGRFSGVRYVSSVMRCGPGGGRHRLLQRCKTPYVVSFDDDSWPVDTDFFAKVVEGFEIFPTAAVLGAAIWHPYQQERSRSDKLQEVTSFTGCGHAIRLAAYQAIRGYLDRPVAYGLEESDVSLQLFAKHLKIYSWDQLRVFHDSTLQHHKTPELVCGTIANVGLFAFLHYPPSYWLFGVLQIGNAIRFAASKGRLRGMITGILSIPFLCWTYASLRCPVNRETLQRYLQSRTKPF